MVMEENIEWIKPSRTVEERQISKAAIPELHDTVKSYQRIYQDLQVITLSIINCSEGNAQFTENQQELSEISMKLIKSLLYIITKLTSGYSSDTINSFRDKTTSEITKISLVGVRDENCITAVNNSNKNEIKKIINNLQYLIYNHSLIALQSSLNQLSNTIFSISTSTSQLVDSKILEIILTCRSIGTSLNKFLDLIATFTSVCGLIKYSELRSEDQFTEDDKLDNIWNYSSVDQLSIIDTATDLNQIVRYITSYTVNSKEKQEEILSCFLKTASLYFKPFDIVKKLEERYLNPRNAGLSKEQAAYIKNTVSEIILVWTAKNIHRLSDRVRFLFLFCCFSSLLLLIPSFLPSMLFLFFPISFYLVPSFFPFHSLLSLIANLPYRFCCPLPFPSLFLSPPCSIFVFRPFPLLFCPLPI